MMTDRRTRKRMATRLAISDAATRLIDTMGFEQATIDEIAYEANVSRATVSKYFPRKEDMFFNRQGQIHDIAFDAVRMRPPGLSPIEALRRLVHELSERQDLPVPLFDTTRRFVETVLASEALKARARQLRDDFVHALARVLAAAVGRPEDDAEASLAAALITATWAVAFLEAQTLLESTSDVPEARRLFLDLIDRGTTGTKAALADTPYV